MQRAVVWTEGGRRCRCFVPLHAKQFPALGQLALALTVAEEPEVADAVEAVREDMDQEPADKLIGGQGHRAVMAVLPVVLPAEADLAVVDGDQPAVRDSDAVGVAPNIG